MIINGKQCLPPFYRQPPFFISTLQIKYTTIYKDVFRTSSGIYDGAYLQKHLKAKSISQTV